MINPNNLEDRIDVDWYDLLLPVLAFAYVFEGKNIKIKNIFPIRTFTQKIFRRPIPKLLYFSMDALMKFFLALKIGNFF